MVLNQIRVDLKQGWAQRVKGAAAGVLLAEAPPVTDPATLQRFKGQRSPPLEGCDNVLENHERWRCCGVILKNTVCPWVVALTAGNKLKLWETYSNPQCNRAGKTF